MFVTVLASNFSDPVHARIIDRAVLGLVALAIVVLVATVVWWRSTRGEHPALAPLEVMGKRRFRFADQSVRAEVLEAVRPSSARGDDDLIVAADEHDAEPADHASEVGEVSDAGEAVPADFVPADPVPADPVLAEFSDLLPEAADEREVP